MKVLFFARRFYPLIGGVEKHVLMLSKELVQKGNEVTVVTETKDTKSKIKNQTLPAGRQESKLFGIEIYRIPITVGEKLKKFQIWWWLWKNRKLIKEADIIHCHDVFYWYLPFCFLFLYPEKKVFTTFHGYEGKFPPSLKAKVVRKISEKLSLGNICVGDFIAKWYGTRSDWVTYGGVELTQKSNIKYKKQNLKLKTILFIGRLENDTGLPIYLKTLNILRREGFGENVEFVGDGNLRKEAERYGEVKGFVENPQEYIRGSRFVFTSGYLSILEAMANKKLVFAVYDNPLKKDYLKMAPFSQWIVIENKPEELAKMIMFFFDNPEEVKKLVEEGYNWVKDQTWEKLAEKYLELWGITEVSSYSTPRVYSAK